MVEQEKLFSFGTIELQRHELDDKKHAYFDADPCDVINNTLNTFFSLFVCTIENTIARARVWPIVKAVQTFRPIVRATIGFLAYNLHLRNAIFE